MSIHTILSQMEIDYNNCFVDWNKTTQFSENATPDEILKFIKTFATRIVEEAQREERERIFAHLVKADKAELLDSANISAFYNGCNAMLTILQKYIESRTKLQKMKEI